MLKYLLLCMFIISLQCNRCDAVNDWGVPGEYLNWGAGARSLGMGKAFVGLANDSSAVYWNPAAIPTLRSTELLLMHTSLFESTNYEFVSIVHPLPKMNSGFGVGYVMLNSSGFEERDGSTNSKIGEFSDTESAFITSYGCNPRKDIYIGGNFKIIKQQIGGMSSSSPGLDLGTLYFPKNYISIGLMVRNFAPPTIKLDDDPEIYYPSVRLGVALRLLGNRLFITTDVLKQRNQEIKFYSGLEVSPVENFFIRGGVDETELTFGMGLKYEKLLFDYSAGMQDLGVSHRISMSYRFWDLAPQMESKIKEFSPYGGRKSIELKILTREKRDIKKWKLSIKDDNSEVIKTFDGEDKLPEKILWNGADMNGNFVRDGVYRCILDICDKTDRVETSNVVNIKVVSKIPGVIIQRKEMLK